MKIDSPMCDICGKPRGFGNDHKVCSKQRLAAHKDDKPKRRRIFTANEIQFLDRNLPK